MKYTIHEMAQLLGVPAHTLRYYEKIGIIRPWTDQTNGYRYYSVVDTRRFNLCRGLRAAGFSLDDCRVLLTNPEGEQSAALLQKQAEELTRKAVLCRLTAQHLQQMEENFRTASGQVGRMQMARLPDSWRLTLGDGESPVKNPALEAEKQRWLEFLPVVRWVSWIPRETLLRFGQGRVEYAPGLMIKAEEAAALGLAGSPRAKFVPGGEFIWTVWRQAGRGPFGWDSLAGMRDWLRQEGVERFGDGYSTILSSRQGPDGMVENFHFLGFQIYR